MLNIQGTDLLYALAIMIAWAVPCPPEAAFAGLA
jgi:hypothetical protein